MAATLQTLRAQLLRAGCSKRCDGLDRQLELIAEAGVDLEAGDPVGLPLITTPERR